MPAANRLKQEKDFAALARSRKVAFSKTLGMKVRENHLPHSRFGVVVGLKVHKRAVKRNLVKRRIREILRQLLPKIKSGYDAMVLTQPKSVETEYEELEVQVLSCLKKLNLLT